MILCVNANAAVDKTVVVPRFRLNAIHRPEQVLALPGGKGCNVARGLLTLGESPVVMGWAGGYAGGFIAAGLAAEGIGAAFVPTPGESRTCLSILDPASGAVTEIYERGEPIPPAQVEELLDLYRATIGRYAAVALSGTLPPGVPTDFYRTLIEIAREHGVRAFLDTSGEPLRQGVLGRPDLVKPNAEEFADLMGQDPPTGADRVRAVQDATARYGTTIVLSLGAAGVLAADGNATWEVRAPQVAARSAVGSGDCLLAGIIYGLVHDLPRPDALRYGVAAAAANTLQPGAGRFARADFDRLLARIP